MCWGVFMYFKTQPLSFTVQNHSLSNLIEEGWQVFCIKWFQVQSEVQNQLLVMCCNSHQTLLVVNTFLNQSTVMEPQLLELQLKKIHSALEI